MPFYPENIGTGDVVYYEDGGDGYSIVQSTADYNAGIYGVIKDGIRITAESNIDAARNDIAMHKAGNLSGGVTSQVDGQAVWVNIPQAVADTVIFSTGATQQAAITSEQNAISASLEGSGLDFQSGNVINIPGLTVLSPVNISPPGNDQPGNTINIIPSPSSVSIKGAAKTAAGLGIGAILLIVVIVYFLFKRS